MMDGSLAYSNTVTPVKAGRAAKRSKRQKSTESRRRHRDTQNTTLVNSSYFGGPTTAASSKIFGSTGNQRHVMTFGDLKHSSADSEIPSQ